jgi:hypothetical protein
VRISPNQLRAYEAGTETIPAGVCALLAECYGEDLTAHVPLRAAPELDGSTLTVAGVEQSLADASEDTVVAGYVAVVQRLRRMKPGDPLPLRAADLTVIAAVLESDAEAIEQKIVDVLGCTRAEARSLHRELLRRRIALPVAGLAASVVALAGVQVAHVMSNDPAPTPAPVSVPGPVVAPPTTAITVAPPTTIVPQPAFTPPTTIPAPVAKPAPVATPKPAPAPEPHVEQTPVTVASTPPSIPEDDTPRGVLPGEEPIHIEISNGISAPPNPPQQTP